MPKPDISARHLAIMLSAQVPVSRPHSTSGLRAVLPTFTSKPKRDRFLLILPLPSLFFAPVECCFDNSRRLATKL